MKLSLLTLATLLGSVGCYPIYDHIDIDAKYTPQELEIIIHSLNEWADTTGSDSADTSYTENVTIGDGVFTEEDYSEDFGAATMQRISNSDPGYPAVVDDIGYNVAGVGREGQLVLTVTEAFYKTGELNTDKFHIVVLHELGHFYGLMHGDGVLMQPSSKDVPSCIDQESLDNFCKIHADCLSPKATCSEEEE